MYLQARLTRRILTLDYAKETDDSDKLDKKKTSTSFSGTEE